MKTLILIFAVFIAGGLFITHAADETVLSHAPACADCAISVPVGH